MRFGADPKSWTRFADVLDLTADMLPLVSNPNAVIAERSTMKGVGKTPSVYDHAREVVGLGKWTQRISTRDDVARWSGEPDYGLCLQTRRVRAIDIDVPDVALADALELAVLNALDGTALPKRFRGNSGKRLLAFRFDGPMPKRVIPVDGGIVEFLGDGQQFVASGCHTSGVPYEWDCADGLPSSIPTLTADELEAVWSTLVMLFATGDPKIAREKRVGTAEIVNTHDEQAQWLYEHWDTFETGSDGQIFLRCPFEDGHSSDSGPTSTAYFLAGTGGYERSHWSCLHASCMGRTDADFARATGFHGGDFAALPPLEVRETTKTIDHDVGQSRYYLPQIDVSTLPMPGLTRDGSGKIDPTADNLNKILCRPDVIQMHLGFDTFRSEIMWSAPGYAAGDERWTLFADADYVRIRILLERMNMRPAPGIEMIRAGVHFAAVQREFDSATEWLSRQRWDGVPRVRRFLAGYWGTVDTPYAEAVSRYIWTALAGRVLAPGCQADMVPIFYGEQGLRKTTAIKAMSPSVEAYTDINLSNPDSDLSRRLRGKLVGELEELRGLQSRDSETIKAWITRTHEEWIPKYKEFGTTFARRLLLLGTTNMSQFLADATGERRFLPIEVGSCGRIDIDGIIRDREQLWAEGAAMFRVDGIDWFDAERLAADEHVAFKVEDVWSDPVEAWLASPNVAGVKPSDGPLSALDILVGALGIPARDVDHGKKMRLNRVMKGLGYVLVQRRWQRVNAA